MSNLKVLRFLLALFTISFLIYFISKLGIAATQISTNFIVNLTSSINLIRFNETALSNGLTAMNFSFSGGENVIGYIRVPKNATILGASFNLSGYLSYWGPWDDTEDWASNTSCSGWSSCSGTYSPSQCYDEDWNTFGRVDVVLETRTEKVWENYSVGVTNGRLNYYAKFYCWIGYQVNDEWDYVIKFWNYYTNSWETVYSYIITSYTQCYQGNFWTISFEVDADAYTNGGTAQLRVETDLTVKETNGRAASIGYYEGEVRWSSYPSNVSLDILWDGTIEWSYSGEFNESVSPVKINFPLTIASYLSTCTPDDNGNCDVPFVLHSDTAGNVQISDINITYDYNISALFTLDTNSNNFYWNQTSNIIPNASYKKIYKVLHTSNKAPVNISISGYYLLNQSATDCWINEVHYTPTGSPLYCPASFTIQRGQFWDHNISDTIGIPVIQKIKERVQDIYRNSRVDTLIVSYPQLGYTSLGDGNAFSVIPINVTNLLDTGESLDINVTLKDYPSDFTCIKCSWIVYNLAENSWNETNATLSKNVFDYKVNINQISFESRKRIRFNLTDIWNNTDSISYVNVSRSYLLPPDAQVEKVYINGTDYTDSPLVTIGGRWVNITWNSSIGPSEILDPEIIYTIGSVQITEGPYIPKKCSEWGVSGLNRCVQDCPDCYAEINDKVRWIKTITLNNTGSTDVVNISVKISIPQSTYSVNDLALYHPNGTRWTIDVINLTEGYINFTVDRINSSETQTWSLYLNTTPPISLSFNETMGTDYTLWFNVTGSADLTYERIWSYTTLDEPLTFIKIYDNTSGNLIDISSDSKYGPPTLVDLNKNGYYDFYQWIIPSIQPSSINIFVVKANIGKISCAIVDKIILNAPISAGENIEWRWIINCTNFVDLYLKYREDVRLPLEASNIRLDGIPKEAGLLTVPPYGPYITIEGGLPAYSSEIHTLEFKTPPVTVDVSPPSFPEKFYVGEKASLVLNIKIKNWASTDVSSVKKQIDIRYGEDLKVYEDGKLVDSQDLVKGYYTLTIENISAYEVRNYLISYKTPTTISNIANYRRKIINQTQYLFYPVEVRSITDFPLSPLYQIFNHTEPYSCKNVAFVWLSNEKEYLNPSQALEYLSFECSGNNTVVKLKDLSPGISEYYDIFVIEQAPTPVAPINEFIFNFFEALIRIIQSFINWVASFVKP